MGNLFGKSKHKESRVTEQDRAVLELKKQRDKLKQYQNKIIIQLDKDRQTAKLLLNDGKKEKAKLLLRKKRFQESTLARTDGQLNNIEQMVQNIEFAQIEAKVIEGLKDGNESLKKMHQLMSLEDVEKIMDETQEAVEYQQEIDSLLAGGLTQQDEDDVLKELDDIVKETEGVTREEDMDLPEVPEDQLPDIKKKERTEANTREAVMAT